MATQTIQFNSVSLSEIGSGTITAFIFDGTTQTAALSTITEDSTLKGQYTGTVTDEAAATYRLVVKFDGITISEPEYEVTLVLATGTYVAAMDVATQTSVDTIDGIVDAILVDTADLQANQGNWLTATGFSTHDAADVVTALGTGSTLTACATATGFAVAGDAMALTSSERSTLAGVIDVALINQGDGADLIGTIADLIAADWVAGDASPLAIVAALKADAEWSNLATMQANVTAILEDTNELQTNQSAWVTATGFATPTNVTDAQTAIITQIDANETKIDTVDTVVDAIKAVTDQFAFTVANQVDANALTGGGGGGASLSGPYTRTITITDDDTTDPIEGAKVRLYKTGSTETKLANASGVVTFTTEAATWSYAATAAGYGGATGTIVISADGSTAIEMTATAISPSSAPLCTVVIPIVDQYGAVLAGEPVEITFVKYSAGAATTPPVLSVPPVQTSDSDGLVTVALLREAEYKVIYGDAAYARRIDITVPDAASYEVSVL